MWFLLLLAHFLLDRSFQLLYRYRVFTEELPESGHEIWRIVQELVDPEHDITLQSML
jgi:hypothetical protein